MSDTDRFLNDLNDRANRLFDDPSTRYIPGNNDEAAYQDWAANHTYGGDTPENRRTWENLPPSTRDWYGAHSRSHDADLRRELDDFGQRWADEERRRVDNNNRIAAEQAYWQKYAEDHGIYGRQIRSYEEYSAEVDRRNAPYPDNISENWIVDNMGSSPSPPASSSSRGPGCLSILAGAFVLVVMLGCIIGLSTAGLI